MENGKLKIYSEIEKEIAMIEENDSDVVFNYENEKENKEARSYLFKLRKIKSSIEKKRKEAKKEALEYGRAVDATAKKYSSRVEALIEPRATVINAIEEKERQRVERIKNAIAMFSSIAERDLETSNDAIDAIDELGELNECGFSFDEFNDAAVTAAAQSKLLLLEKLEKLKNLETERAELEKLRAEKTAAEKRENERAIAEAAAAEARKEAEAEAAKIEADLRLRAEKEKTKRLEAEAAAKKAIEDAEKDIQEKQARAEAAAKKAANDAAKIKKANGGICRYLQSLGCDDVIAKRIADELTDKKETEFLIVKF